ncbi:MAG: hypothetical protein V1792_21685 [Pseudomonadota bacterium]
MSIIPAVLKGIRVGIDTVAFRNLPVVRAGIGKDLLFGVAQRSFHVFE